MFLYNFECFTTPFTGVDKVIVGATEVKLLSWDISELKVREHLQEAWRTTTVTHLLLSILLIQIFSYLLKISPIRTDSFSFEPREGRT